MDTEAETALVEQPEGVVTMHAVAPSPPNSVHSVAAEEHREPFYSEMIPDDLLFALTEVNDLLQAREEGPLAPVKTLKTPKEMRVALKKGVPDNVWHHKARRLQFRHLTEFPRSDGKTMGSRDVSFLYDVAAQVKPAADRPSKFDKSAVRLQASRETNLEKSTSSNLAVPDSIIPEEYHLVKSKAVLGLEYLDDKLTTSLADKEKSLRVFPSLKPAKRFEVIQLMKTMDQMLAQAGVDDVENEAKGPTQIHNLLEIIKKEQQIYDVVFHEMIRQVSIECLERGQLLSKLRQRYSELLSRIPRQIKSLHAEVMAQRALDRRLTEELLRFKSSIGSLTNELIAVKEHDKKITKEAETAQVDLAEALKESQKNANLVDEYHDLYELQRHRLESQVSLLTEERDLWCNASYSLSLKIIAENSLSTAKRLHVTEKAWHKLGGHFSVMISDHDTECLVQLQEHVQNWRDMIFHFNQVLEAADNSTINVLTLVKEGMERWLNQFDDTLISIDEETDAKSIRLPPLDLVERMHEDIASWEEMINENSERFIGDTSLSNQEQLIRMGKEVEIWTDIGIAIYDRHRSDTGESYPQRSVMMKNNGVLQELTKQLDIRICGENGVAKGMIMVQNNLDTWNNKFFSTLRGGAAISESEWLRFYDALLEYIALLSETIACVGSQQKDEFRKNSGASYKKILVSEAMDSVQEWLKNTVNGIDGENGKMIAQVSNIHIRMVHWMVQMLLFLAPTRATKIPFEASLSAGCTLPELVEKCKDLCDHISRETSYICQCTQGIVEMAMQKKKDAGDEDADHEYRDFLRIKMECKEWIRTCQLLLNTLVEEPVKLLDETINARLQAKSVIKKTEAPVEPTAVSDAESTSDESKPQTQEAPSDEGEPQKEEKKEVKPEKGKMRKEQGEEEAKKEPGKEEIKKEPGKEEVKEEPGKEETKKEPGKEETKKEPEKEEMTKEPGKEEVKKEPVKEKLKEEPRKKEEEKEPQRKEEIEVISSKEKVSTIKKRPKSTKAVEKVPKITVEETQRVEERAKPVIMTGSLEVIGADENVQSASLEDVLPGTSISQETGSGMLSPPSSSLTQTAYDAIAKMDELQAELLETEERAQEAELNSVKLEEELNAAREKIRALEKELQANAKEVKSPTPPTTPQPAVEELKVPTPDKDLLLKPGIPDERRRSSSRGGLPKKDKKTKKK